MGLSWAVRREEDRDDELKLELALVAETREGSGMIAVRAEKDKSARASRRERETAQRLEAAEGQQADQHPIAALGYGTVHELSYAYNVNQKYALYM